MKQIFILTWFLFASANGHASTCEAAVAGSQHAVVIAQIQQLNPELLVSAQSSEDWPGLYVLLKNEEFKYGRSTVLPENLKTGLVAQFSSHYEFQDFGDAHFRQFYINSLRSLYVRVAAFWAAEELERLNGGPLNPDIERVAARVLESTSSPWTLKDRDLLPTTAKQYFQERPWAKMPWPQIFSAIAAWKKYSPFEFTYDKFGKFWTEQGAQFELSHEIFMKIQQAASGFEASLFCCLSQPGCNNCPHNRRWLK